MSLLANYFFLNSHLHCSRLKDNGRILRWEGGIGMTTNISRHPGLLHSRVDVIQEFVLAKSFIIWLKHWKRNQEGLKSPAFFFYDVALLYQIEGLAVPLISTLLRQAALPVPGVLWLLLDGCRHGSLSLPACAQARQKWMQLNKDSSLMLENQIISGWLEKLEIHILAWKPSSEGFVLR